MSSEISCLTGLFKNIYNECCHKVRHPFERVVSAYQDKVIEDESDWMDIEDLCGSRYLKYTYVGGYRGSW